MEPLINRCTSTSLLYKENKALGFTFILSLTLAGAAIIPSVITLTPAWGQIDPRADFDGDGLPDGWEVDGIDMNKDGIVDLSLSTYGANPYHKDIFIEVDYMKFHRPFDAAMQNVIRAFNNAPLGNPDGKSGINLHIQINEEAPHVDIITDSRVISKPYFGTSAERTNINTLNAKKLSFHWSVFIHGVPDPNQGGWCCWDGNNFQIVMGINGAIDPATGHRRGTIDDQSHVFMHEFFRIRSRGHICWRCS